MDTYTSVVAGSHSPDGAAAVRWAARFASRRDHDLRVVCPVGVDSRDLAGVETDVRGATESRRERAQQWAVDQLDDYLETLTIRIETPVQCMQDAVAAVATSTNVLVVGSSIDTSVLNDRALDRALTVVHVSAHGRARRGQPRHREVSA
jgi:hypothetical protein